MSDLSQQLVTAIKSNVLANVQEILAVTHDSTLFAITTPVLHHALKPDMFDIFSLLVKRKFNFAVKDADQDTVLYKVLVGCLDKHGKMLLEQMIKNDGYEAVYKELTVIKKSAYFNLETNIVAQYGLLDFVKWCHENNKPFDQKAMDKAAGHGYLDVVKFLHENRTEGCTTHAMDNAANGGHLDVIQYLHAQRTEGCSTNAIDNAAWNGHLDVIMYLVENRNEGCTIYAMNSAAEKGHLDVIKLLDKHKKECTTSAMNNAAAKGHLDTVKWLHENRTEGCTTHAMNCAAAHGHLDTVKWLHEHNMKCTTSAMDYAALYNRIDVLKWLHEHNMKCTSKAMNWVANNGQLDMVKYLFENVVPYSSSDSNSCSPWTRQNIDDAIYNAKKHPDVVAYLTSVRPADPIEKLEKAYFDRLSINAYDNFVKGVMVNHAQEIVKQLLQVNDINNLLALLLLPRYANIDATYLVQIITLLIEKKQYTDILNILDMSQSEKINAEFIVKHAIDVENYDLLKQVAKKYKDDVMNVLSSLPKEQVIKCLTHVLN